METSLTSIDPEVLDAAEVDGATGFKKLRHVILPLIKPFIPILFFSLKTTSIQFQPM
jgi:ABC-type sugar transport system permease subunit